MPIYEFECGACGKRFEELVGEHVGRSVEDVRCPACGSTGIERRIAGSQAPPQRSLTASQKRRLEQRRGIDRGGAGQRFRERRAARRARAGEGG